MFRAQNSRMLNIRANKCNLSKKCRWSPTGDQRENFSDSLKILKRFAFSSD